MWLSLLLLLPAVQDAPAAPASTPQEPQVESPGVFTPLMHFDCQGVDAWLVDAKDLRLLHALQMIDDRLLELPTEIPDFQAPPGVVPLVVRLLSGPSSFTIGANSKPIPGMPMPFAAELRLAHSSDDEARALASDLAQFIEQMGVPMTAPEDGGAWVLPAPIPSWLGDSDGSVVVRIGLEDGVDAPDLSGLLPAGARVSSSGMLDYGEMLSIVGPFLAGADPDFAYMLDAFEMFGLQDMAFEWASGTDDERSYTVLNMPDWAMIATENGLLSKEDLSPRMVAAIPGDATWATAFAFDLGSALDMYREMVKGISGDPDLDLDAEVERELGLNIERDIVAPFGGNGAIYASDTTGGGGLFSTVAILELKDHEAFRASWKKLEDLTNNVGREEAMGYVRFSHLDEGGLDIAVLSFPGLPIPLELCMAEIQDFAVFAITPQALLGAVQHITSGSDNGLIHNPAFQDQLPRDPVTGAVEISGVLSITWVNTPRLMQDGYSGMGLLCSALANMVRSPGDATREPGILLPPFHQLRDGAKPIVTIGRRVGDDFRSETRGDRSQLVNGAGIFGYLANSPVGPLLAMGMMATIAVPRIMEAESHAEEAFARIEEMEVEGEREEQLFADIDAIYMALDLYSRNNGGKYPETLDVLAMPDENGESYIPESMLFDPWGDAYIYEPPAEEGDAPFVTYQE